MKLRAAIKLTIMTIWTILCIVSSMLVYLVTFNWRLPLRMARRLWAPGILKIGGLNLKQTGFEYLSEQSGPYIVVCNHLSYLDIPCLFATLPINIHFIAKDSLKWIPFLGWYMKMTRMILVKRGSRAEAVASMKKAAGLIQQGRSVLIFPEGTRSKTGDLGLFRKGVVHLAEQANVKLLVIGVRGTEDAWPSDEFKIESAHVDVQYGEEISPKDLTGETATQRAVQLRAKVKRVIDTIDQDRIEEPRETVYKKRKFKLRKLSSV